MDGAVITTSYDASSHIWLGGHGGALAAAGEASGQHEVLPLPHRSPTRLAIACLDAALAHTALGDPDAAGFARPALPGDRIVQSVWARAEHLE